MEENNTDYTELETETFETIPETTEIMETTETTSIDGYIEENTDNGTDESTNGDSSISGDSGQNGESEDNVYDGTVDNTDGNGNSGTSSDGTLGIEDGLSASSGTAPGDTENPSDVANGDLLESLNALVNLLTPETDSETGELTGNGNESENGGGNMEPIVSEYDTETLETLQSINATLNAIQAENELWHAETLRYREEARETQKSIIVHLEFASLLLIAVGFFVALQCGGKFADIFFKRMKGDER